MVSRSGRGEKTLSREDRVQERQEEEQHEKMERREHNEVT